MRRINILSFLTIISFAALQSCSSSTTPPTVTTYNSFTNGATASYQVERRDTTGGTYGMDVPDPTSIDSIHTTVLTTTQAYNGKTGVVAIDNFHVVAQTHDTSYYWQDPSNGDLYHYNYGVESLNNSPVAVAFLGQQVNAGWVLQSKQNTAVGTSWQAGTPVSLPVLTPNGTLSVTLADTATKMADTTITYQTKTYSVQHTTHVVTAAVLGSPIGNIVLDTYVSTSDGLVFDVTHSTALNALGFAIQAAGQQRLLISHS